MFYPLTLIPDDNDTFLVTCDDLPEVTSFGDDLANAIGNGASAVEEAIAARMDAFEEIPRPSQVGAVSAKVSLALQIKLKLYWTLLDAGMNRAEFVRVTGWPRTKVDRLFDPHHESKLSQIEEAFNVLNKSVELELVQA